jgi:hypothetical protein
MAFTEQGVAMLSSVLRGERAVQVNIAIMRAFVKLRQLLATGHLSQGRAKRVRPSRMESRCAERSASLRPIILIGGHVPPLLAAFSPHNAALPNRIHQRGDGCVSERITKSLLMIS